MRKTDIFEKQVLEFIDENKMFDGVRHCVCGVSGGADSVSLLTVLARHSGELGITLHVVHVNHMIRGAEADRDQSYVEALCREYGVECVSHRIDVIAAANEQNLTVEEAGRKARYAAFEQMAAAYAGEGCVVAVAHNRNDVAETVLFNMARGTGMAGVKGISPVRDGIVRPLLACDRSDIEAYLLRNGIAYCTDATNNEDEYTRNKIRHRVLPVLSEINAQAAGHICAMAETAAEYDELVSELVKDFLIRQGVDEQRISCGWEKKADADGRDDQICIGVDIDALQAEKRLVRELVIRQLIGMTCGGLKDIGRSHVSEVEKLFAAENGAGIDLPMGVRAYTRYGKLIFARKSVAGDEAWEAYVMDVPWTFGDADAECAVPRGIYNPELGDVLEQTGYFCLHGCGPLGKPDVVKKMYTKCIDYDRIKQCLHLRTYRDGDYMVINSAGARKKLNRIFTDCKVPPEMRKRVLLVCSGSEVVWAVGMRIGENYKITDDTKRVVRMELRQSGAE